MTAVLLTLMSCACYAALFSAAPELAVSLFPLFALWVLGTGVAHRRKQRQRWRR